MPLKMSVIRQALFAVAVSFGSLSLSTVIAWPSSTLKLFSSVNTTLDRQMDESEIAFVGSLPFFGALIGTPVAGLLLDTIGRKYTCVLFSLPSLTLWIVVSVSYRVEAILAARFISGMGGSMLVITSVYISEFCHKSIRGTMTSGAVIGYNLGLLISYFVGGSLDYYTMNYVFLSFAALSVFLLLSLKESPVFLIKKGREKEAAESLVFFRGCKKGSEEITQEIMAIKRACYPDIDGDASETEKLNQENTEDKRINKWRFFKKSQSTRRALFIVLMMDMTAIFQGPVVVQVYAGLIFKEAIPNLSSMLTSVLYATVSATSACFSAYMMDIAGRRTLMIVFCIGSGICCMMLGTQIHFQWGPHWVAAVFIYLFCLTFTFSSGTVPFVVSAEVFLPEIRGLMTMICMEWAWICDFLVLFVFNWLVALMGLGSVFYLFATVAFTTATFCFFFLPETKGLPVDVIQTMLYKKKIPDAY